MVVLQLLRYHAAWDSSFLDSVALRLHKVEEKLGWYADRFICDGHPLAIERDSSESVAGGLKNITNRGETVCMFQQLILFVIAITAFLTELCDMDLINSRKLTSDLEEKKVWYNFLLNIAF